MRLRITILFLLLLVSFNTVAHFLPWERASLAPDDYSLLQQVKVVNIASRLQYFLICPDRPLYFIFLNILYKIMGDNSSIGLIFIFLISTFVLILAFLILKELLNNNFLAFVSSVALCLLPNMLEMYHTPIYGITLNAFIGIYMLSFLFYIYFIKRDQNIYLILSALTYTIGIFCYEVGFFIPIVFLVYNFLYAQNKPKKHISCFIFLAFTYLIFRLTRGFGLYSLAVTSTMSRGVSFSISPLIDLFHNFFGRYMIRNAVYGIYKFFFIESPWLMIIAFSSIILLIILASLVRKFSLENINKRLLILASVIFVSLLMPIMLFGSGIGGRHLVLPSLGVVIFAIWLLEKTGKRWRIVFLGFIALALVICQGNAWTQVVSCRINGAVYETMKERKEELVKADNIVIDTKSFADKIPFTWIQRDFNVLNTYYGAQTFEDWGLKSMVYLVTDDRDKSVYIAKESPRIEQDGLVEFTITNKVGYRSVSKKTITLPLEGTVIIEFKDVYGENFNNGIREK